MPILSFRHRRYLLSQNLERTGSQQHDNTDTVCSCYESRGLHNHLEVSWAMDFFTVITLGFSFLYVFVVFEHGRRRVIHLATTYHPSMEWVIQQLREATPFGRQPRFLFRDNDGIYGHGVRKFLDSSNIEEVRTAYRSPWQSPYIERFLGTLRRELLDHV